MRWLRNATAEQIRTFSGRVETVVPKAGLRKNAASELRIFGPA